MFIYNLRMTFPEGTLLQCSLISMFYRLNSLLVLVIVVNKIVKFIELKMSFKENVNMFVYIEKV